MIVTVSHLLEEFCRNLTHELLSMSKYVCPKMTSLFPNTVINLNHVWYDDRYVSKKIAVPSPTT